MKTLAKFIAVLSAILFVISLVAALFLYSLEKNAFDAETYKEALQDEGVYERLPAVIGDQLVSTMGIDRCAENPVTCDLENRSPTLDICLEKALGSEAYQALSNNERSPSDAEKVRYIPCFNEYGYPAIEKNDNPITPLIGNLTAKDWELLIIALIPPDDLENMSEETIDQLFAFLNGSTDSASISFRSLKNRLVSEAGTDAVMRLIEAQPSCTASDLLKLANLSAESAMVFCNPPEITKPLLRPFIEIKLKIASATIPEEKVFLQKTNMGNDFIDAQSTRLLMRLSPLLPIILLLLITMLVVRSLYSWLRWWGIPLLTTGIISLILSLMTAPILQVFFSMPFIGGMSMDVSGSVTELIYDLLQTITHRLVENIAIYALILIVLGLVMTIGSIFAKRMEESIEVI
ncbi:MAG: hypothetical protein HN736_07065 [Anaerolineae bacterium]|jgi:hypothetical protein|nr:hypothetical protein [Anaerolineae bacterium]MBT3712545.1 hypothetical protein [Anaerolineae bacterium]MBT4311368.1 hypothetical protein [Anaerolineae bacterium]MBT4459574.1 hypothetical protein [Anaerolineae bacterium]MBT4841669.1 hypothetical protein [Anaerolineae bacterium]